MLTMALEVQDDLSPCSLADHTPSVLIPSPVQPPASLLLFHWPRMSLPQGICFALEVHTSGHLSLSLCSALNLPSLLALLSCHCHEGFPQLPAEVAAPTFSFVPSAPYSPAALFSPFFSLYLTYQVEVFVCLVGWLVNSLLRCNSRTSHFTI